MVPSHEQAAVPASSAFDAPPSGETDVELIRRYAEDGDEEAFATLVRRYTEPVYATCRRELGDPAGADDAAQATFLVLERRARSLARNPHRPVIAAWLLRTARLTCANARRERRRRDRHERAASADRRSDAGRDPRLDLGVDEALDRLPPRYREPLVLRFAVGKTVDEVAAELRLGAETVRSRLARGLEMLRHRLGAADDAAVGAAICAGFRCIRPVPPAAAAPSPRVIAWQQRTLASLARATLASTAAIALPIVLLVVVAAAAVLSRASRDAAGPALAASARASDAAPYALAVGRPLYAEAITVWQLELPPAESMPDQLPLDTRAVEYALYRYDVDGSEAGATRCRVTPLLLAVVKPGDTVVDDGVTFTDASGPHTVSFVGAYGRTVVEPGLTVASVLASDGSVRSAPIRERRAQLTYDSGLVSMGAPAWLPPLPSGSAAPDVERAVSMTLNGVGCAGTVSLAADGTMTHRFPALHAEDQPIFDYPTTVGGATSWVSLTASLSGDATITSQVDGAAGLPATSASTWRFAMRFAGRRGDAEAFPAFTAAVSVWRDVRAINLAPTSPGDRQAFGDALLAARGAALAELVADPSPRLHDAPVWASAFARGAAFAALHRAAHPDGRKLALRSAAPLEPVTPDVSPARGNGVVSASDF